MIGLILVLVVVGVILYLIETYVPMDPVLKTIIRVVVVICVCLYLLNVFGVVDMPIPKVR